MPQFAYVALNREGIETSGRLAASSSRDAAAALRQNGLRVLNINELAEANGAGGLQREIDLSALGSLRPISTQNLIFFYRQLAFMLRAGLPVAQALQLSHAQVSSSRLKQVVRRMIRDIESGSSLSQAVASHPTVFSGLAVNLIIAGESTGEIDVIVDRLATHLEKRHALRTQTISALTYPALVILAAIGVGVFLVTKIIPKFGQFLAAQGRALPPSTQFLIDVSASFMAHGTKIFLILSLCTMALVLAYRTHAGRLAIDALLLRLPVIGNLLLTGAMAQMTWGLALLLRSGVTVFDALKVGAGLMGNRVLSGKLVSASNLILEGRDLSSSLRDPVIPALVTQMIAIGENTGTLDRVLQELGSFYERSLETGIKRLSSLIEPALILLVGGMVGFVYYAFFQAMFQLASRG